MCNLFASVSAAIYALWGPLHGGANQAVIEMLQTIYEDGGGLQKYVEKAKDPKDPFRLMGFGHRVYKNFDPRSRIIKTMAHNVLEKSSTNEPLLELALKLEEIALKEDYFIDKKLYPNVDFYSGLVYRKLGIPRDLFTPIFAISRVAGWLAHWREQLGANRIFRPSQIYTGSAPRDWISLESRE